MKKLGFLLMPFLLLGACGDEPEEKPEPTAEENSSEEKPIREEVDAEMKKEALEIDYVAAKDETVAAGTIVKATGEILAITGTEVGDEFKLVVEEDGETGYFVSNQSKSKVEEGRKVTVYGTYDGKNEEGIPKLTATLIE